MSNILAWRGRVRIGGLLVAVCVAAAPSWGTSAARPQEARVSIRLRSFALNASGQLTIEPSAEGGRARLTALRMPDPQSQARGARAYVVWANSEGRILRLGELRTDRRGNGGFSFKHPGFDRYTVIVTAEQSPSADRPFGAPVLSTRAGEATALFRPTDATAGASPRPTPSTAPDITHGRTRPARRVTGDFYSEVDGALDALGGGRVIELEGAEIAPRARGRARAAAQAGRAYVVVRFGDVPLPRAADAEAYVMWALAPDGRIVYMGSLPADESLNLGTTYVRVPGLDSDQFDLFVTAERARPAHAPSDRRALSTRDARNTTR